MNIIDEIVGVYGNKVRIRVCGILVRKSKILLLKHSGIGESGFMWIPPGGGVQFGESLHLALKREFREEIGIDIEVGNLVSIHEYIGDSLHAIEFFFEVHSLDEDLKIGYDPETNFQIINDSAWFSYSQLKKINKKEVHQIFQKYKSLADIRSNFRTFLNQ